MEKIKKNKLAIAVIVALAAGLGYYFDIDLSGVLELVGG
jgi:hypothetical protein